MADTLKIQLLGGFSVRLNEQPVRAFRTAKTRALLAYLVTEADREHGRSTLATLFWGELPDSAAKTNLRIELSNLKSLLVAHPALELTRNDVRFHSALATTDVQSFQRTITSFLALPIEKQGAELAKLAAAIDLYEGEFLAGFNLNDAIEFEDWQSITREQLHEQLMLALRTLQAGYAEQGRWVELADAARRQLAIVPWTEAAHRNLMQALAAQGQVQAALAQFEKCREVLQEELGVEPSLPTLELAARLRGDMLSVPSAQHNLPQQLKLFVGRKQEITELRALVQAEKLVTLLGIGGVGKSHLAQAVAQNVLHDFADGVWFVPLANIEGGDVAPERIALAIAAAIGFQVTDLQMPLAEVATHLANKQMLLVLDNWDHLVEAAPTILYALRNSPAVHILATSRVRLMSEGEVPVPLGGLPRSEAFTLFVERARRTLPSFSAEGKGITEDVYKICEQVAGLPLGIEMAASWVEHYDVAEIGRSIAEFAVEPQQQEGFVNRHHRLSGVFEFSWQLLSLRHQQILSHLSAFRGGFDRAAAAAVTTSNLGELSTLIAHSMLQRVSAGRYDLHPLIQEFAAVKLLPEEEIVLSDKYSHHYLSRLIATERAEWTNRLRDDFENLRSAWQRAVTAGYVAIVQQAAIHFGEYVARFGLVTDGELLFANAVRRFEGDATHNEFVAELLDQQAVFVRGLRGLEGALGLLQRVLALATNPEVLIRSHLEVANHYAEVGKWEPADFHFDQAEQLAAQLSDQGSFINVVEERTHINAIHFRGDFAEGIARLQELLLLFDDETASISDEENLRARVTQSLALIAIRYGDYAVAIRYAREALMRADEIMHRRRGMHVLLDIALAEQFAGMYAQAIAHNREALAIAEEIGDADEVALLDANLCLTLRQAGELEAALVHGLKAIKSQQILGNKRIEGQARNRTGHTLSALGRWADAYRTYGDALVVWEALQHPNRNEAVAGRAASAFHLGKHEEALALVEETLDFVARKGLLGIVEPMRLLLNCETVLSGLGQIERARQVLSQAEGWMEMIAGRISDEEMRTSFLHQRPDNQLLKTRMVSYEVQTRR